MPTELDTIPKEKSTCKITASFEDSAGNAVTPKTATWTLTDVYGTVINSREDVNIASLDTSVTIVLSGNDLKIQANESGGVIRLFLIEATYDSDLGSDLPLKDSCQFTLENLKAVI